MRRPARRATNHLANGYWAATMQGVNRPRYAAQVENWLRLRARAGLHLLGGAVSCARKNPARWFLCRRVRASMTAIAGIDLESDPISLDTESA